MTKKKLALSIGSMLVVTAPVVALVSCSSSDTPHTPIDPMYGEYTAEQVEDLNSQGWVDQEWRNGQPKFILNEQGLKTPNPEFVTSTPEEGVVIPPVQPNTNPTSPVNVIEEHRQQAQQHDVTGIVGLTQDELATIQTWTDEQFDNFKKLINFEIVTINGTPPLMKTPGFDNKDMATLESRTQRAYDIIKNNNDITTRTTWRALVLNPNYIAPAQPPVINGPSGPSAPPAISQDDRTLLNYRISVNEGNKLTSPRALPPESSTWSDVEKLVYQWWDNKGPAPTIYTVRRQIIAGSITPLSSSSPNYNQIITGPTVPPLPGAPNTSPQGSVAAPANYPRPTLVEQQTPEIVVPPMLEMNIPSK